MAMPAPILPTAITIEGALACVRVSSEDFDLSAEVHALRAGDAGVGAVVSFVGTVREWVAEQHNGELAGASEMELEHYPGMTERSIAQLIVQAWQRFDVRGVRVIHRVGPLAVSDQIVLVAVTSAHRGQAFQCAEFLMDWLKTQAPFWKKESSGGESRWVDARHSDDQAAARWGGSAAVNSLPNLPI
ncbi:MAG: molybdenum cofactor biosynthesis protein MoaE [Aquabacterium sp.]|nr:molybdenum cofactor biosynthesis protein MoaE [Aquabacterium sp.]